VHWGTLYPPWLPPEFNAKWSEWPRSFERYARHLAPDVEVRVLPPGDTTTFVGEDAERTGEPADADGEARDDERA
jgi:hypothetical protein